MTNTRGYFLLELDCEPRPRGAPLFQPECKSVAPSGVSGAVALRDRLTAPKEKPEGGSRKFDSEEASASKQRAKKKAKEKKYKGSQVFFLKWPVLKVTYFDINGLEVKCKVFSFVSLL